MSSILATKLISLLCVATIVFSEVASIRGVPHHFSSSLFFSFPFFCFFSSYTLFPGGYGYFTVRSFDPSFSFYDSNTQKWQLQPSQLANLTYWMKTTGSTPLYTSRSLLTPHSSLRILHSSLLLISCNNLFTSYLLFCCCLLVYYSLVFFLFVLPFI